MREAIRQAIESVYEGGLPFGAALYDSEYQLIDAARNLTVQESNPDLHAEVVLLSKLSEEDIDFSSCTLVTNVEPCVHCFEKAYLMGIRSFTFGSDIHTSIEYFPSDLPISIEDLKDDIEVDFDMTDECDELLRLYKSGDKMKNSFISKGTKKENYWMNKAFEVAKLGMYEGNEIPVGVIVVQENDNFGDEVIISESYTMTYTANSPVLHGDINALLKLERHTYESGKPAVMYSTLEPHLLGFGSAMKARLRKVVYGLDAPDGGSSFFSDIGFTPENHPLIVGGVGRDKQYELFLEFLEREKDNTTRVGYSYAKEMKDYYDYIYKGEED